MFLNRKLEHRLKYEDLVEFIDVNLALINGQSLSKCSSIVNLNVNKKVYRFSLVQLYEFSFNQWPITIKMFLNRKLEHRLKYKDLVEFS